MHRTGEEREKWNAYMREYKKRRREEGKKATCSKNSIRKKPPANPKPATKPAAEPIPPIEEDFSANAVEKPKRTVVIA